MNFIESSIKNSVMTWMLMIGLILFGAIGFKKMGVSQLPDIDFPNVNISISLDGAAPEVIETQVIDPVENAVMGIEGVESLSSSARSGNASINVEFNLDKDIDVAVQEIQAKISQAQRRMPREIDPPIITKSNPEDQPIMWISFRSDRMSQSELMSYVRDQLRDKFATLPGVSEVFLGGFVEPNLRVWLDPKKLERYQFSADDVISTIQQEHKELPAGKIEGENFEKNIRTLGEARNLDEFKNLVIQRRGGAPNFLPIRLGEVAQVEEGLADVRRVSRVMGNPAIGLGVRKQRGVNAVQVSHEVKGKMKQLESQLPPGSSMAVNFDSTVFIEEAVGELNMTLVLSAILTALVCWLFLGSWSATLNVVLAIPTSILGSFIVLHALGFTLNTFTLLGLSLAIGIVVDDAIMVLENIVRYLEKKYSKKEAALRGAKEIGFAALAATAAIIAIFLPVAYMDGMIGKFFFQFGVTISVAVALSLVEALTLTPMRCSQFVETSAQRTTKLGKAVEAGLGRLQFTYVKWLPWFLQRPWKTVIFSLVLFVASLGLVRFLKKEMVPPQDQGSLMIRLKAPEGSSLKYTDDRVKRVEQLLSDRKEVEKYFVSVGGFGGGDVNTATLFITLVPRTQRKQTQQELAAEYRKFLGNVEGIKATVQDLSLSGFAGGGRGFPIELSLRGPDWNTLIQTTKSITQMLEKDGRFLDVDTNITGDVKEVQIIPKRKEAASRGVSVTEIARTISYLVGGTVAGNYVKDGRQWDIRVRLLPEFRSAQEQLNVLRVRNNRGELIPLSEVVEVKEGPGLLTIQRKNRERAVSIFSNLKPEVSQGVALKDALKIGKEALVNQTGYRILPAGSSQGFGEAFSNLIFALVLGIVVSYMILAAQFNSFLDPVIVLLALPFSLIGAFAGLLATGQSLNIYSMIGVLLLMGLVKKNSILLVEFANRQENPHSSDSILTAASVRLRPILMTSFATIAGALPAALALGPGAESRVPMAVTVIGGVLVSTFLTLIVVPCFYLVSKRRLMRKSNGHGKSFTGGHKGSEEALMVR